MVNLITSDQTLRIIETNISTELYGKQFWGDLDISPEECECIAEKLPKIAIIS